MIFKKKRHLLNSHILHLTFSLVGTLDSGRESSVIPHKAAFESLLCDLEVFGSYYYLNNDGGGGGGGGDGGDVDD